MELHREKSDCVRLELEQSDDPPMDRGREAPSGLYVPTVCVTSLTLPPPSSSEWEPKIFLIFLKESVFLAVTRTLRDRGLRDGELGGENLVLVSITRREGTERERVLLGEGAERRIAMGFRTIPVPMYSGKGGREGEREGGKVGGEDWKYVLD